MNDDELLAKILEPNDGDRASQAEQANADKRDIELRDGDSGGVGEELDDRADGFNSVERVHDWRSDSNVNAGLAQELTQSVMDDGGYVEHGSEAGNYGRAISTFRDKHGRDIAPDLVRSGAAMPTQDKESVQAQMTGITRRALGYESTPDADMNAVGQELRDTNDEFTPWEGGEFQAKIRDRRGNFERAFDRGTDETKAALGGALNFIGEALGNEDWVKEGELAAFHHGIAAASNRRQFGSYEDVEDFSQAVDYVVESLGEAAPGLLVDAMMTAGTVAVGAATGGSGAAVGVGAMGAMGAARAVISRALYKGAKRGLYAGPAASGFVQSSGYMENRLDKSEKGEHNTEALSSGLVGAATNALPFLAVMGRSLKATGLSDEAARPVLDALANPSVAKRLKDVLGTAALGAGLEGSTAVAQTVIDEVIATELGGEEWHLDTKRAVDAGLRAVIGGGTFGAIASTTGNTAGFIRQYNEAKRGFDAEGEAVNKEGYKEDTVEETETDAPYEGGSLSIEQDVARVAKRKPMPDRKNKKPDTGEDSDLGVAGQGQFDSMTTRDVPNLKSTRYDELRQILEPKGKPVSPKELGALVENGVLTDAELASYAADSHYGSKTPLSGGYDKSLGDGALASVFKQVVNLSREGKYKLSEAQKDRLTEAEQTGTDTALKAALNNINPELTSIVYRNASKFDGRAMFRDYAKIKSDRVKTRERIKKEQTVEKDTANAPVVKVPEGEAPVEKPKGIIATAPDWVKEGRKPSKNEVDEAMGMLDNAKDKLRIRVRSVIEGKGKNTQGARDIFAVEVAKTPKQLAEVGQHYGFETTGSMVADKLTLLNKIVDSSLRGTTDKKTKAKKPKPATTDGKLAYLKRELGTRTAGDGDMSKLLEAGTQYRKNVKDGDALNPKDLTDEQRKAIKQRDVIAGIDTDQSRGVVKSIDALLARNEKHDFNESYVKAVDNMYKETAANKSQREMGERTDQQVAYTEKGEDGEARNIGDVQSTIDTGKNDLEVAAHFTRRTDAAVEAFRALRKVDGLNGAGLTKFMRKLVEPTAREAELGDKLPKRKRSKRPIDNENTTRETQFAKDAEKPPLFTHGKQEKRPDARHLSEGVVNKLKQYLADDNTEAFGALLEKVGVLPKEVGIGEVAKVSASERLAIAVRSSFAKNKMYRNSRVEAGQNRSDRGAVVRDNETGKAIRVDFDAVTRWAMREDKLDLHDTEGSKVNFANELAVSVLNGISALAELRLDDGRPMFSIDLNTIKDDTVVYRMDGDKLASITMGSIRGNIHHKGKKFTPKKDVVRAQHVSRDQRAVLRKIGIKLSDRPELHAVKTAAQHAESVGDITSKQMTTLIDSIDGKLQDSRTLSDLAPEDIGNVYRDEVTVNDTGTLIADAIEEGRISLARGEELYRDMQNNVFDKDHNQAAKEGGELTVKTQRVDDEISNRDEVSMSGSNREVLRKTARTDKRSDVSQTVVRKRLEEDLADATARMDSLKNDGLQGRQSGVKQAKDSVANARKDMKEAIIEAIRRDDVKGYKKAQLHEAHANLDKADDSLLNAVANADAAHKGRFNEEANGGTTLAAELHNAQVRYKRAVAFEKALSDPAARKDVREKMLLEAEHSVELAKKALALLKDAPLKDGSDLSKGRKIQLNRKLMKVVKRNRGMAKKGMFRLLEMTRTRLNRIHPDAALRADKFTAMQRNATEYFASRIGKDIGDSSTIQKGYEDSVRKVKSPERDKYEAFVRDLNTFTKKHDKNFEAVTTKVHVDLHAVERNREGFLSILRADGVKNPDRILESILDGRGYPEFAIRPELTNQPKGGRKGLEGAYEKLKEGGFIDTDAPRHLLRMVNSATSWAAWNETHGGLVNGKWDSNAEFNRIQDEVHAGNRQEFAKLYQGVTGRLGMSMSPKLRALNSAALAFQAATVLWFTGLASVPEVAATYARMRGDTKGMLDDAKSVLTSVGREKMYKVARDYDIITEDAIEQSLQEMYNMNDLTMGRMAQKIQATVFKYNGQNYVTKMTRAIATKAGERYLVRAVEDGAEGSKRLAELGVTAKDVQEFAGNADLNSPAGRRYREAVHQFVNEAVTNPRATQLPLVANDPRFLLVTTLKKFFYGFYDNVHKSLASGFKGEGTGINPMTAIGVTAAVAIPLALMAEVIREMIRYPFGRPAWQGERDIAAWGGAVIAASGLLGPATMAESVYAGTTYGNHPVVAAAGPTTQFAVDVATLEMQPSRVVPLVNQIPWLAQPLNDKVKNLIK